MPELVAAVSDEMLHAVGYFGPAGPAPAAFARLSDGLDEVIVRIITTRPGLEPVIRAMTALTPPLIMEAKQAGPDAGKRPNPQVLRSLLHSCRSHRHPGSGHWSNPPALIVRGGSLSAGTILTVPLRAALEHSSRAGDGCGVARGRPPGALESTCGGAHSHSNVLLPADTEKAQQRPDKSRRPCPGCAQTTGDKPTWSGEADSCERHCSGDHGGPEDSQS
jgi:hypothetical protein